jgi:hypothetical protein
MDHMAPLMADIAMRMMESNRLFSEIRRMYRLRVMLREYSTFATLQARAGQSTSMHFPAEHLIAFESIMEFVTDEASTSSLIQWVYFLDAHVIQADELSAVMTLFKCAIERVSRRLTDKLENASRTQARHMDTLRSLFDALGSGSVAP